MTYGDYFILSAREGDVEALAECLTEDVPIDYQDDAGNCALHMASANNHEEAVRFLLERGADINRQNKSQNTALHWAALTGHLRIVKLLCETQKQDCNLKNHAGLIAFEYALQAQKTEVAEYLAPLSKLEDDKVYSEIPEAQFWPSQKD